MNRFRRLRCSFCRKDETKVSKLVAGPRVYICDECIAVANRLMTGGEHDDLNSTRVDPTLWRKLLRLVRPSLRGKGGQHVSAVEVAS